MYRTACNRLFGQGFKKSFRLEGKERRRQTQTGYYLHITGYRGKNVRLEFRIKDNIVDSEGNR
jgi:hypothetical protein